MSQTAMPHTDNDQADNDLPGSPLEKMLHSARTLGLLPANAQPPADPGRPWPVVLLTLLGAWLAALPVLAIFALFAGRWVLDGAGTDIVDDADLVAIIHGLALFVVDGEADGLGVAGHVTVRLLGRVQGVQLGAADRSRLPACLIGQC